ncbi:MAG: DNA recombination/repair protein RecA, partial [Planctomycetota bacterium]
VKNKVAPPFRIAEFDMMHSNGISYEGDILDLGITTKVISRTGAWLKYGSVHLGQGKEKARAYLIENPQLTEEIKAKVLAESGQIADLVAEKPTADEAESDETEEMIEA